MKLYLQRANPLYLLLGLLVVLVFLILLKRFTRVPSFVFRKLLHAVAFSIIFVMTMAARNWTDICLASVLIMVLIYPLLKLAEKWSVYSAFFAEKSRGEVSRSFLMLFGVLLVLTLVCWGVFGEAYIGATAILMWGNGDAAAALIGIPFGKHKIRFFLCDGKKSWEGSLAAFVFSYLFGVAAFLLVSNLALRRIQWVCLPAAFVCAFVEAISPSEWDTVSVPLAVAAVLLILL